ncbi:DUF3263 domain-containing protein [Gulosibacter sp. 10]|uniref:DUF3263 domain-containing protein n=1 Tax=Gulosibacter sp. 10 TaxID=1255570 RepID=UPI00097EF2ED|nr:DUF3263 domain-containing protein [Gulosibacter sp. 10]SJM71703.1 hypothetical protein FM112_16700 [Gulosibacter sp. 10]
MAEQTHAADDAPHEPEGAGAPPDPRPEDGPLESERAGAATESDALTDLERGILEFEEAHPRHSRAKEDAIRADFGYSPTRYYQILGTLIESPVALVENPLLIGRLRRIRDRKRDRRYRAS